jgi:imidazolonepropionase-like amidohydrolase
MSKGLFLGMFLIGTSSLAVGAPGALRCGTLLDVVSGRTLTDALIVYDDHTIVAVGPAASTPIPAGTIPVELPTATCLPGLIDVHTHLLDDPTDNGYEGLGISVPRATVTGAKNARATLLAGFTTVRNLNAPGFGDVALRDGIQAGDVLGPRMLVSGPALGITGGHADNNLLPWEFRWQETGIANGPWEARARVRANVKYGADVIKVMASGGVLSKGDRPGTPQYTFEELQAIIEEAHKLGRRVAAHAHGTQSIKDAIRAGVDSVEHASLIDDEGIALAKKYGTYLVFDIYNDDYIVSEGRKAGMLEESIEKEQQIGRKQRESFRRAFRAGVRLAFGTDAGVYPHGENARQFSKMVEWDMPPLMAIRTATINAADLLGLADKIGQIAPGYEADVVAVEGQPTVDVKSLENMRFVMKGGRVFRDDFHSGTATNPAPAPPGAGQTNDRALADEVLTAELTTWELEKRKDKNGYAALMAPGYIAITDRGVMNTALNLREIDDLSIRDYAATDVTVRSIGQDVALLTYNVSWKGSYDGKQLSEDDYAAAIWAKSHGRWIDAYYQETPMHHSGTTATPPAVIADRSLPVQGVSAASDSALMKAERLSWELARRRDHSAYGALLDEDFVEVADFGRVNKTQNVRDLDNLSIRSYSLEGMTEHPVSEDVVILTYKVTAAGSYREEAFQSANFAASVWAKRSGQWFNVLLQETPTR